MSKEYTEYERKQEERQDREANQFACALLMPADYFLPFVKEINEQSTKDEDAKIKMIADYFKVPVFAVHMRLQMFGLINI